MTVDEGLAVPEMAEEEDLDIPTGEFMFENLLEELRPIVIEEEEKKVDECPPE